MQMRNITPMDINTHGLLPGIQEKLNEIGISIDASYQNGFYNGCRFTVHSPRTLAKMECNYAFAWMFGIMVSFDNNLSTDMLTLYQMNMLTLHPSIDRIGFKGNSRNSTKHFFPLTNGGINKMTMSSDELVTSQYINGFKMATLASLSTSNNNIAIHSINPIKTQNNTSVIKANFTLAAHQDADPSTIHPVDSSATNHLEYYLNILPSSLTSFQCDLQYKDVFDFVVLKMNQQNVIPAFPSNTINKERVGELRVNVEPLKTISDMWMVKLKYYGSTKPANVGHDNLLILKTNIRLLTSSGDQLDTEVLRYTHVSKSANSLRHQLHCVPMWCLLNLSLYTRASQIAIHSYCFQAYGFQDNKAFATIMLEPLSQNPQQINALGKKFF